MQSLIMLLLIITKTMMIDAKEEEVDDDRQNTVPIPNRDRRAVHGGIQLLLPPLPILIIIITQPQPQNNEVHLRRPNHPVAENQ